MRSPPRGWEENALSEETVAILADAIRLEGALAVPESATGMVLFAHGSGSSRLSPRNNRVAGALRRAGMATLLFDLLTEREATARANVFDVDFLARRLHAATVWVRRRAGMRSLPMGYFGASTGAAAALIAAADDPTIRAIVSRGGRPDLAKNRLGNVKAPTLLIVGGDDLPVLRLNEEAYEQLRCERQMAVVPGASHLFEEPGTLDEVTRLAVAWFSRHFETVNRKE
jgi:putative phosphoribosyl transferase